MKPNFVLLILLSFLVTVSFSKNSRDKPNIIFILSDDLGYADVGFTREEGEVDANRDYLFNTPTIDRLATEEGIILERHYVHSACTPTRAAFLTGKYPFRSGLNRPLIPYQPQTIENEVLIPEILSKHGNYATMMAGKWHVGYKNYATLPLAFFDEATYGTQGATFYYTKSWCTNPNAIPLIPTFFSELSEDIQEEFFEKFPDPYGWCHYDIFEGVSKLGPGKLIPHEVTTDRYVEDIFFEAMIDFIDRFVNGHDYYSSDGDESDESDSGSGNGKNKKDSQDGSSDTKRGRPKGSSSDSSDKSDSSDISDSTDNMNKDETEKDAFFIYWAPFVPHTPLEDPPEGIDYSECDLIEYDKRKTECKMMQYMDSLMNDLVNYLVDENIWDDTIIVFTSDNGGFPAVPGEEDNEILWLFNSWSTNLPFRGTKSTNFEAALRSASFITGGYLKTLEKGCNHDIIGSKTSQFISIEDWFVTFLNLAKISNVDKILSEDYNLELDSLNQLNVIVESASASNGNSNSNSNSNSNGISTSQRHEFVDILPRGAGDVWGSCILRSDGWKLVVDARWSAFGAEMTSYHGVDGRALNRSEIGDYDDYEYEMLFNVFDDPEERYNLIYDYPEIAQELQLELDEYITVFLENDQGRTFMLGGLLAVAETGALIPYEEYPRYRDFEGTLEEVILVALDNEH